MILVKTFKKIKIHLYLDLLIFRIITKTPSNTKNIKKNSQKHQTHTHTKHDLTTWSKMRQNACVFTDMSEYVCVCARV